MGQVLSKKHKNKLNECDINSVSNDISFISISEERSFSNTSFSDLRGSRHDKTESICTLNKESFPNIKSKHINILIAESGNGEIPKKK
eukprot:177886_1